ncbi:hypothetical protein AZE42_00239 [Rhizopogon vesiculosus]|uniref:Xylanolytic transcriptional activator regulatory domain-containing protein n=1 Tax=Rhizopogon vesiculosus TaxID=180088 RepID=A0A1J8QB22_9AGAM|nr:hypothetical protein AZE42_00239 [Rhizopogon vesiculosus]
MPPAREAKSVSPTLGAANPKKYTSTSDNSKDKRKARKVRCVREDSEDPKQSCKHCIALGIPCTYDYQPKKRGPPNLYLRRLQEAAAAASSSASEHHEQTDDASVSPNSAHQTLASHTQSSLSPSSQQQTNSPFLEPCLTPISTAASTISPSRYSITADTYHTHHSPVNIISPTSFNGPREVGTSLLSQKPDDIQPYSSSEPYGGFSPYNWSYKQHQPLPVLPPTSIPPLSYYYRPRSLEDIAPRDRISLIIALFFDFVYPLTPCIHKPSFMADLHTRREERDPLFFALVMSTLALTLVQVPRSYLPMERSVVRKLAQTCYEASRHITIVSYDPPTSMHVVIRYFDCVYHFCEGHDATQHAAFGEAAHIAVALRMHEETSYEGLDPIECEVRRRTFWLLFDADKSMSILLGRPICLRDEDCTVHFPKELDDEYIISNAYLPQPRGKTALVSGLNYISRIFALLGEILVRIRVDKRSPPQGQFATARLEEVQALHSRIMGALAHVPAPLKLKQTHQHDHLLAEYGGAGFRQATFAEVKDFFDNPKASRANALNPFLVMQANLYVTQQLVRFVVEQYRDELVMTLQGTINDNQVAEDREATRLTIIRNSIPIQSIATNGPSLVRNGSLLFVVHKVRFVASTLLDTVQNAETAPASAARAHAFLWDFLSILSEIERNYLLDDDRDGASSGDVGTVMV